MYFDNMVLYYKPTCPFCHKVLAFMEQEDIAMPMRDTLEPGVKDDLIRIAGKARCRALSWTACRCSSPTTSSASSAISSWSAKRARRLQQTKHRTRQGSIRRVLFYGRLPQR